MTDRRPGHIETYITNEGWARLSQLAQDRHDERVRLEQQQLNRVFRHPPLWYVGALVVAVGLVIVFYLLLLAAGVLAYDPAFGS